MRLDFIERDRRDLQERLEKQYAAELCDCGHSREAHHFGSDDCIDCSCTYFLAPDRGLGR